jgi:hypothetical protein
MRKLLLASTALVAFAIAPALAQEAPAASPTTPSAPANNNQTERNASETNNQAVGTTTGAATGAIAGAVVGGPVGALVGGFAGAVLGAATSVPEPAREYVVAHPVAPVSVSGPVEVGMAVPASATLTPIPDYPDYSYVYIDGRPVIVEAQNREVVYSPGYVVPDQTVTYVEQNPIDPVAVDTTITTGATIPDSVVIQEVPNDPAYGYVYTESGPVLVNRSSRTVVWTR